MPRKSFLLLLLGTLLTVSAAAQTVAEKARSYIDRFAPYAVLEMHRSAVPASITLAQGMLESGYGLSRLSTEANNHFGIQCHKGWNGPSIKEMDNGELRCFRAYDSALESYRDHSDFLRGNRRYGPLFELKPTDYKGWAKGLSKCGYAEDRAYPEKLINLIETYDLRRFDKMSLAEAEKLLDKAPKTPVVKESKSEQKETAKERRRRIRREKKEQKLIKEGYEEILPEAPAELEAPKEVRQDDARVKFSLQRPLYSKGGVLFVYSIEGETYESIAAAFNLFPKEILRFNDLKAAEPLQPGTIVYIEAKRSQAVKGLETHVVEPGETLRDIAQDFGVKEKALRKINGFSATYEPESGEMIRLRKP